MISPFCIIRKFICAMHPRLSRSPQGVGEDGALRLAPSPTPCGDPRLRGARPPLRIPPGGSSLDPIRASIRRLTTACAAKPSIYARQPLLRWGTPAASIGCAGRLSCGTTKAVRATARRPKAAARPRPAGRGTLPGVGGRASPVTPSLPILSLDTARDQPSDDVLLRTHKHQHHW